MFVGKVFAEFSSFKQNGIACFECDNVFAEKMLFTSAGRSRLARYFTECT
jgi:hypothetical protein